MIIQGVLFFFMRILFWLFLFISIFNISEASEIAGSISTNPKEVNNIYRRVELTAKDAVGALRVKKFPDGSLVRLNGQRVYLLYAGLKKWIRNPNDLRLFKRQVIFPATSQDLAEYVECGCINGELVKTNTQKDIFILKKGKKLRIKNLKELTEKYPKQKIFTISFAEMSLF